MSIVEQAPLHLKRILVPAKRIFYCVCQQIIVIRSLTSTTISSDLRNPIIPSVLRQHPLITLKMEETLKARHRKL